MGLLTNPLLSYTSERNLHITMNKYISSFSIYVSLAFIFSYIEAILPISIGIPGIKLGFANIIIVLVLYINRKKRDALYISILRVILVGFTFGNLSTMIYSLCGGILSSLIMILLYKTNKFSIIGVSIAGGTFHNIGQLLVASFILETSQLVYYLPILIISGIITGACIGTISKACLTRIKNINNNN